MPTDLACSPPPSPATLGALDLAAHHLHQVSDRLLAATALVRRLAASTDWQTPAARAFFVLASRLSDDVGALGSLADAVRAEIRWARARAMTENPWDCR